MRDGERLTLKSVNIGEVQGRMGYSKRKLDFWSYVLEYVTKTSWEKMVTCNKREILFSLPTQQRDSQRC